jgi:protocatechuate 3,4-dioxygenase beta subunit
VKFEVPPEGGDVPVEIRFTTGGSLLVMVPGPEGEPLEDAMITITRRGGGGGRFGRTDESGEILFTHLKPGTWSLKLKAGYGHPEDRYEVTEPVVVREGETTRHTVGGSAWIRGVVLGPDGRPLANAIVRLTPVRRPEEGYRMLQTETDREGRYLLRRLRAGEYHVDVQVTHGISYATPIERITLQYGESKTHEIRVPDTSLEGRITRSDSGEPLDFHQVQITAAPVSGDGPDAEPTGRSAMAFADEDGRYRFAGLRPGRYKLWVTPLLPGLGLQDETRLVEIPGSGRLEGVDFALPPKGS